jgi:hypothetical protein
LRELSTLVAFFTYIDEGISDRLALVFATPLACWSLGINVDSAVSGGAIQIRLTHDPSNPPGINFQLRLSSSPTTTYIGSNPNPQDVSIFTAKLPVGIVGWVLWENVSWF